MFADGAKVLSKLPSPWRGSFDQLSSSTKPLYAFALLMHGLAENAGDHLPMVLRIPRPLLVHPKPPDRQFSLACGHLPVLHHLRVRHGCVTAVLVSAVRLALHHRPHPFAQYRVHATALHLSQRESGHAGQHRALHEGQEQHAEEPPWHRLEPHLPERHPAMPRSLLPLMKFRRYPSGLAEDWPEVSCFTYEPSRACISRLPQRPLPHELHHVLGLVLVHRVSARAHVCSEKCTRALSLFCQPIATLILNMPLRNVINKRRRGRIHVPARDRVLHHHHEVARVAFLQLVTPLFHLLVVRLHELTRSSPVSLHDALPDAHVDLTGDGLDGHGLHPVLLFVVPHVSLQHQVFGRLIQVGCPGAAEGVRGIIQRHACAVPHSDHPPPH